MSIESKLPKSRPVQINKNGTVDVPITAIVYLNDIPFIRFYKPFGMKPMVALVLSPNDYHYLQNQYATTEQLDKFNIIKPKQRKYSVTSETYNSSNITDLIFLPSMEYKLFMKSDISFLPFNNKYVISHDGIPDIYSINKKLIPVDNIHQTRRAKHLKEPKIAKVNIYVNPTSPIRSDPRVIETQKKLPTPPPSPPKTKITKRIQVPRQPPRVQTPPNPPTPPTPPYTYENHINTLPDINIEMNTNQPKPTSVVKVQATRNLKEITKIFNKIIKSHASITKSIDKINTRKTLKGKRNYIISLIRKAMLIHDLKTKLFELIQEDVLYNQQLKTGISHIPDVLITQLDDIYTSLVDIPKTTKTKSVAKPKTTPNPKIIYVSRNEVGTQQPRYAVPPKTILVTGIPKQPIQTVAIQQDLPEIVTNPQPLTPKPPTPQPLTPKPVAKSKKIKPFVLDPPPDPEDYDGFPIFGRYNNDKLVFPNHLEYDKSIHRLYEAFRIFNKADITKLINTQIKNPNNPIMIDYFYDIYKSVAKPLYDLRLESDQNYDEIERLELIENIITENILVELPNAFYILEPKLFIQFLKDILVYMSNTSSKKDKLKIVESFFINYKFIPKKKMNEILDDYQINGDDLHAYDDLIQYAEEYLDSVIEEQDDKNTAKDTKQRHDR